MKVNVADIIMYTDWLEELYLAGGVTVEAYRVDVLNEDIPLGENNYPTVTDIGVDLGTQLHYCDYVAVALTLHLPQSNIWQGKTGEFAGKVGVIQWNDMCEEEPPSGEHYLDEVNLHVLDGIADDSFDLYVDGTLVYTYVDHDPGNDPELWRTHMIDLSPYMILCGTNTVKIEATGAKWSGFGTYGQLAVDEITLSRDDGGSQTVDIGDTTSESGHNPVSWGPIEPANSGGAYGGIDHCRVTWDSSDDTRDATIDFSL